MLKNYNPSITTRLYSNNGKFLKEYAKDVDIHISTQANIVSYHNANFWSKNGAKRVILGRELNKEQIKKINISIPLS